MAFEMKQVLLVWTESNPSTMEKEFLLLNGLEKCGISTHAFGFSHSKSNRLYFENVYAKHALYSYTYGNDRGLYQGRNYIEKIYSNLFLLFWFSTRLYKRLRMHPTSVIIIPTNPLEITLPVIILGKIFGIRVIPNIMEYEPALPSFYKKEYIFLRCSWTLITKYSDAYIVISRFLEGKIKQISRKKVFCLPAILPSGDMNQIASHVSNSHTFTDHLPDGIPVLIFSCGKGYDDLLQFCFDAIALLDDMDFRLIITGEYPAEAQQLWMEKAIVAGLTGKVGFSGFLPEEELRKLQIHSKALLMPLFDTDRHRARFPQKILGYMRIGKPVITTKVGEMGEYFEDNVSVLMDESVTAHGYSEKIRFLLDHPAQAEDIGLRGASTVESRFNELTWGMQLSNFLINLGS